MLELRNAVLRPEYRKEWNEPALGDFQNLYLDGVKISDTLYRVGGIGGYFRGGYTLLLKYNEAFYSKELMDMCKENAPRNNKHLEGCWCIINENGEEKVNFDSYKTPYLSGGVIYCVDRKYYNIETGELYCSSYTTMSTNNFLFLNNEFDNDKSKRGVLKIDKKTGLFELIN